MERILFVAMLVAAPLYADAPKAAHTLYFQGDVKWLAFTPDGKKIITGSNSQTRLSDEAECQLQVWDVATGKSVAGPVKGFGVSATGVVSPDGKLLLTGGFTGMWKLWKLADLAPVADGTFEGIGRIDRAAFTSDGKAFAVLHMTIEKRKLVYTAYAYDTATQKPLGAKVDWPEAGTTRQPAGWTLHAPPTFAKNGMPVAPTKEAAAPLEVPGDIDNCGGPTAVAQSADGKLAVSSGCNGAIAIWDMATRKAQEKPLAKFEYLAIMEPCLAINADGRVVAVASMAEHDKKGHIYSLTVLDVQSRAKVLGPIDLGATGVGLVSALGFSPDGTHVAVALSRLAGEQKGPVSELQLWAVPPKKKP